MNNQIKEEGLTDAYLLGKYDGIKQGKAEELEELRKFIEKRLNMRFALDFLCKQVIEEFMEEQLNSQDSMK